MEIGKFLTLYLISVPIFFIFDMVWLGFVAKNFYRREIGHLLGDINWVVAIAFYLLFLVGLTFFAIYPAVLKSSFVTAIILGALFGFFTYATYDLTNWATLKGWSPTVAVVDIIWGTVLGAMVSALTYLIYAY